MTEAKSFKNRNDFKSEMVAGGDALGSSSIDQLTKESWEGSQFSH
jgi:hypothetical protein